MKKTPARVKHLSRIQKHFLITLLYSKRALSLGQYTNRTINSLYERKLIEWEVDRNTRISIRRVGNNLHVNLALILTPEGERVALSLVSRLHKMLLKRRQS